MKLFGYEISLRKAVPGSLQSVYSSPNSWLGSVWRTIQEPFAGAWQKNITADPPASLLASSVVYACVTGIAGDIAKNRIKLAVNNEGIWDEVTSDSPFLSVLKKPNHYQTRIKFVEQWIVSKLLAGNTYVLKERDARGVVRRLYVLNPQRVKALVAEDGSVWYQLSTDYLSQVEGDITVPASEIIHDMATALWHPLCGVPPIYACAMSATMGNKIQQNSTNLYANASRPGGILTAPGLINDETAARLKEAFEANFSGTNVGRLAVLGDGLKFEPMILTAEASQTIEQLKWSVEDVTRAFHYPIWKVGGPLPPYSSGPEALTMMYYTDCLQPLIESLELCLDEGLELPAEKNYGTEVDIDNLLRMDTKSLYESNNLMVGGGWGKPNDARFRANLHSVTGGDTPYLQQQNFSLAALAKRDALADPFGAKPTLAPAPTPLPVPPVKEIDGILLRDIAPLAAIDSKEAFAAA